MDDGCLIAYVCLELVVDAYYARQIFWNPPSILDCNISNYVVHDGCFVNKF